MQKYKTYISLYLRMILDFNHAYMYVIIIFAVFSQKQFLGTAQYTFYL